MTLVTVATFGWAQTKSDEDSSGSEMMNLKMNCIYLKKYGIHFCSISICSLENIRKHFRFLWDHVPENCPPCKPVGYM